MLRDYKSRDTYQSEKPRWRTCIKAVNDELGHALAPLSVDRYFDERAKKMSAEMIDMIKVCTFLQAT